MVAITILMLGALMDSINLTMDSWKKHIMKWLCMECLVMDKGVGAYIFLYMFVRVRENILFVMWVRWTFSHISRQERTFSVIWVRWTFP